MGIILVYIHESKDDDDANNKRSVNGISKRHCR